MSTVNSFIFCKDQFFASGLAEVIPCGLAQGSFTFFDNAYILEHGAKASIYATMTQPIIFVDNDLDYYALKILTKDMNTLLFSKKSSLSQILNTLVQAKNRELYKVRFSLTNSELQVLECLMLSPTIELAVTKLKLSEKTVYSHRYSIIKKLELKNRNALHRMQTWANLFK